jgi:hypothetical protein
MKPIILKLTFLLAIIMSSIGVQAQTTQGTDFYVSFGNNNKKSITDVSLQIRIVATKATRVTYTFTQNGSQGYRDIAEGEVYTLVLTEAQKGYVYQPAPLTGSSKMSLYIHSTEPVTVYALNQVNFSTDATNLLPVNSLGTDYYHISYVPYRVSNESNYDACIIVATENNTTLTIDGVVLNIPQMNKGEVYSIYPRDIDMTGSHIISNHPIAVFSANTCAKVPSDKSSSDYLFQQMLPVSAWGKKHFVPVTIRETERVRIVASQDNTTITTTGGTVKTGSLTLNKGQFVELEITLAEGGCYISADKPVGVCSYLIGAYVQGSLIQKAGDPAIAWVPSVEQFAYSADIAPFIPDGVTELTEHYAVIVVRTNSISETTMRIGTGVPAGLSGGTWTTGANPEYSFYNLELTDATQSYTFANPNGLLIMGYGLGSQEAYYYLAASALRNISAAFYLNGELYSDVNGKEYCAVSSLHIKSVLENKSTDSGSLQWFVDGNLKVTDQSEWDLDLTSLLPGWHTVRMQVIDLNNQTKIYETKIRICERRSVMIPVNPK